MKNWLSNFLSGLIEWYLGTPKQLELEPETEMTLGKIGTQPKAINNE